MSTLSAFPFLAEQSFATPGAWNSPLSIISANMAVINADIGGFSGVTITPPSGNTITVASNLSVTGQLQAGALHTDGPIRIDVNSNVTNYLYLSDASNLRSDYIIGSQVGGTADGLNIWDDSGQTMIVSFSKQSIRFFQQVVGPVFDVGGALANTLNAATFGTAADSTESRIQAAITAASLANVARVYVPANMYPYSASSVSFVYSVQMVREGGDWSVWDVKAYGASGAGTLDDSTAINQALLAASATIPGTTGTVESPHGSIAHVPPGVYSITTTIAVPNKTVLRGIGRSSSVIAAAATFPTASRLIRLGNGSGAVFGCRAENLTVDCADRPGSIGLYTSEAQEQSGGRWLSVIRASLFGVHAESASAQNFGFEHLEIGFASTASAPSRGIKVDTVPAFRGIHGATVDASGAGSPPDVGIELIATTGHQEDLHIEYCKTGVLVNATGVVLSDVIGHSSVSTCVGIVAGVQNVALFGILNNGGTNVIWDRNNSITLTDTEIPAYLVGQGSTKAVLYPHTSAIKVLGFLLPQTTNTWDVGSITTGWANIYATSVISTKNLYAFGGQAVGVSGSPTMLVAGNADDPILDVRNSGARAMQDGEAIIQVTQANSSDSGYGIWVKQAGVKTAAARFDGIVVGATGSAQTPGYGFSAETSLGLYRSGVSTIAVSSGTVNLATNAVRLSMRTIAASALTASAANTNVAVNEVVFTIQGSGASFAINSGGTTWLFNSDASAKNT